MKKSPTVVEAPQAQKHSTPALAPAQRKAPPRRKTSGQVNGGSGDGTGSQPRAAVKRTVTPPAPARAEEKRAIRPRDQGDSVEMDSREILRALIALKKGDFSVRMPIDWTGTPGKIADTFNEVAEMMEQSSADLSRI